MDIEWVRNCCLELPHVKEQIQWGDNLVFKVAGRIFAIAALEPSGRCLSFKCSDQDFAELIERPGIVPAPYLARAHWVALEPQHPLTGADLDRLLRRAHALVSAKLPKTLREKLNHGKAQARQSTRSPARKRKSPAGNRQKG